MRPGEVHAKEIEYLVDEENGHHSVEPDHADLPRVRPQLAADLVKAVHQPEGCGDIGHEADPGGMLHPFELRRQCQGAEEGKRMGPVAPMQGCPAEDQPAHEEEEKRWIGETECRRHQPYLAETGGLLEKVEDHPEDRHGHQTGEGAQTRLAGRQDETQHAHRDKSDLDEIDRGEHHGAQLRPADAAF